MYFSGFGVPARIRLFFCRFTEFELVRFGRRNPVKEFWYVMHELGVFWLLDVSLRVVTFGVPVTLLTWTLADFWIAGGQIEWKSEFY